MKLKLPLIVLSLMLLTGCASTSKDIWRTETKIVKVQGNLQEQTRAYVTGTVDALDKLPEANRTKETELATRLSKKAQGILGLPKEEARIKVSNLLSENVKIKANAEKNLQARDKTILSLQKSEKDLNEKLVALQKEAQQKAAEFDAINNKNIISRIWHWGLATFGLAGLIALCVFCPAVIPFIIKGGAWLLSHMISAVKAVFSSLFDLASSAMTPKAVATPPPLPKNNTPTEE